MRTNKFFQWFSLLFLGLMAMNVFGAGFADDHNDGVLNGWTQYGTRPWSESGGKAIPTNANPNSGFLINNYNCTTNGTYEITATADQWNGNRGGFIFRWTSTSSYYFVAVLPGNQWSNGITFCKNTMNLSSGTVVASSFAMGTTFTLKIEITGSTFKFYIDNTLRGQITDASNPSGKAGYGYSADWNSYISYDNVVWTDQTPTYQLTTATAGSGSVTPSSGTYPEGTSVTITATPALGWVFDHWSGDASGSQNPITITMGANKNVTAHFVQITYTLTTTADGNGTVTPSSGTYVEGTSVELAATPASGWKFDHWSGDFSGSQNPAAIVMNADKNITAHFMQITYTLSTTVVGPGTVSPESGTYVEGTSVELTATPAPGPGRKFDHWSGDLSGSENPATIVMNADKNITAYFIHIMHELSVSVDGQGTVSPNSGNYPEGVSMKITATPASGWKFDHWSGDASGSQNPMAVAMDANKTITAHFIEIPIYSLSISTVGPGSVVPGSGNYPEGSSVTLTATPISGWKLDHWSGDLSGSENPVSIVMNTNKNIIAHFAEIPSYTLSVTATGGGSVSPKNGLYLEGTQVTVTATADVGWVFDKWDGDGAGTSNPYTITMDKNKSITAAFIEYVPPVPNSAKLGITAKLFDKDGSPVGSPTPVTYDAVVKLYNDATAGVLKYTESFLTSENKGITIEKGYFVARLGEGITNDNLVEVLKASPHLWVEVTVDGEALNRFPLTGAAYLLSSNP